VTDALALGGWPRTGRWRPLVANVVHIIARTHQGLEWSVKWYFVEPNVTFISVHH
jgi:hypothetical protein